MAAVMVAIAFFCLFRSPAGACPASYCRRPADACPACCCRSPAGACPASHCRSPADACPACRCRRPAGAGCRGTPFAVAHSVPSHNLRRHRFAITCILRAPSLFPWPRGATSPAPWSAGLRKKIGGRSTGRLRQEIGKCTYWDFHMRQ